MGSRNAVTVAISAILLAGCATVTRGTTEAFVIETDPGGAKVTTSLGRSCEPTPCVIPKVSREADFTVMIEKEGYKTATYNVSHQTSGGGGAGMAGNIVLGGVIGALVDANNGATQELVPNPLVVTLEPEAKVQIPETNPNALADEATAFELEMGEDEFPAVPTS